MAKNGVENFKQPKSLVWHPPKFKDHMQQATGVLDDFTNFDHSFLQWNLDMKYYAQVIGAYKRGMIGRSEFFYGVKKDEVAINIENWKKMEHIWYYGLDILNQYNAEDQTIVAFAPLYKPISSLLPHQKIVHLPALKKMNPIKQLAEDVLGVMIRELVPLSLAWEGHDIATMVTAGHWTWNFGNGTVPQFKEPSEIALSDAYVYWVSRDYWHSTIDILEREFGLAENELYLDNHNVIEVESTGSLERELTAMTSPGIATKLD